MCLQGTTASDVGVGTCQLSGTVRDCSELPALCQSTPLEAFAYGLLPDAATSACFVDINAQVLSLLDSLGYEETAAWWYQDKDTLGARTFPRQK